MSNNRLLVIDDDAAVSNLVAELALACGYAVKCAPNAYEFRAACREWQPSVVVLDLQMPDTDGVELVRFLAAEKSRAKVILISGFDARVLASARRLGHERGLDVAGTLLKPFRLADAKKLLAALVVESSDDPPQSAPHESVPSETASAA